jgi:molybdate transport system substrate-binding protein
MKKFFVLLNVCTFFLLAFHSFSVAQTKQELIVAAAADLQNAFSDIKPIFEKDNHCKLILNFGSTGLLVQQIKQGAPFDILAAANVSYIEQLEKENLILPNSETIYARGRIGIWYPKDSPFILNSLSDLTNPQIKRIAIANPVHAPYGVAAKEALVSSKIWDLVKDKLIYGENISETKQYAQTGNVDAAIIALSLSQDSVGRFILIDESLHNPLNQALGIIKQTKNPELAKKFCDFLTSSTGKTILKKYGFQLPQETSQKSSEKSVKQ